MAVDRQTKLPALEALRLICALAVLFWHYSNFYGGPGGRHAFVRESQPLYGTFPFFFDHGYWGVHIFWCISGFILTWKYSQTLLSRTVGPWAFFVLRFSRLYPLHLATLLLVAALQFIYHQREGAYFVYQVNDLPHFLLQLLMASNWGLERGYSFNGPIWSISVEVLVYVVFFIVARNVTRLEWLAVVVIAGCGLARWLKFPLPLVDCLAFFFGGTLSACAFRVAQTMSAASTALWGSIGTLAVALAVVAGTGVHQHRLFAYIFLVLFTPVLLLALAHVQDLPGWLQKAFETGGNLTYASYLLHFPIQIVVVLGYSLAQQPLPRHSEKFLIAYLLVTLAASYVTYRTFEMPWQKFLRSKLMTRTPGQDGQ